MKKITLLLTAVVFTLSTFAFGTPDNDPENLDPQQKGIIKGKIAENQGGLAIEFASISVFSLPDSTLVTGVISSSTGTFEIKGLNYGKYYIIADFIGFEKKIIRDIEITKKNKIKDCGSIVLEIASENIGEVSIEAEKDAIQYKIDRKVVNISKNLSAAGGNVADALENTPSIQLDAEGNVSLRGSSSYTVLIDGKPTALSGADALKQIPAGAVENVEIITNPSAKFDPDGTSGIINIIMKKDFKTGLTGIISAAGSTNSSFSGDVNLNYRTKKFNFFIGGDYREHKQHPTMTMNSKITQNDTVYEVISTTDDRKQGMTTYKVTAGLDYYLNKNNTLTTSAELGHFGWNMRMYSLDRDFTTPASTESYTSDESVMGWNGEYFNVNLNFKHDFATKGHNLSISTMVSQWDGVINNGTELIEFGENWKGELSKDGSRVLQNTGDFTTRLKVDYVLPIAEKYNFELGWQSRTKQAKNDYNVEVLNVASANWSNEGFFGNAMDYSRNIQSAYSTFGGTAFGVGYKAGLRGEYTDRQVNDMTTETKYSVNRFDLFPSMHLSKELAAKQQIQASYSRRVHRPREWKLSPFPMYSGKYVVQTGNPELQPELTDSYELNYMKRFALGFASLEGFYRNTEGTETRVMTVQDDGIIAYGFDNIDNSKSYGAEISTNLNLAKWFTIFANANLYNYVIQDNLMADGAETQSFNTDFRLNNTFKYSKTGRFQITGMYRSPTVTTQGTSEAFYGIHASVKQDFFKRKLTVSLSARDIFNTMEIRKTNITNNMVAENTWNMEGQVVRLNLSYKINNYTQRRDNLGGEGVM